MYGDNMIKLKNIISFFVSVALIAVVIINKDYLEDVTYEVLISKDKLDILSNYSYQIIKEEYIKKFSN